MNNAERIVRELDSRLDHPVRLILYGRAAIALGYENPPPQTLLSLDVDVIIPLSELEQLQNDRLFWAAQEATNEALRSAGHRKRPDRKRPDRKPPHEILKPGE
jgi:hypothetical protein